MKQKIMPGMPGIIFVTKQRMWRGWDGIISIASQADTGLISLMPCADELANTGFHSDFGL
jgi:hypothetical protein